MRKILFAGLLLAACHKDQAHTNTVVTAKAGEPVAIAVTEKGFEPDRIAVSANQPTKLVFTRKTDKTCATEVVMDTGDKKIDQPLPLGQAVEIDVTFPKAGQVTFACGMDMVSGIITVQ
jgi:plastocyanin domain-containing protein